MKNLFITGGQVNTGFGVARLFASRGYNVVLTSRRLADAQAAAERISAEFPDVTVLGIELNGVKADNTVDEDAIANIFSELDRLSLSPDCLVLNAANLGIRQRIFENPLSDFANVISTNVIMNYAIIEQAAARMRDRHDGSIVFINSNTSYRAIPDRIAYSTSKSAQLGMMRALAIDLGKYNIRVNAVLPGMIKTDRWDSNYNNCRSALSRYTPLGDIAEFDDIAEAVWYFAEHSRNTTGAELTVDGGNTVQLYPIVPENPES